MAGSKLSGACADATAAFFLNLETTRPAITRPSPPPRIGRIPSRRLNPSAGRSGKDLEAVLDHEILDNLVFPFFPPPAIARWIASSQPEKSTHACRNSRAGNHSRRTGTATAHRDRPLHRNRPLAAGGVQAGAGFWRIGPSLPHETCWRTPAMASSSAGSTTRGARLSETLGNRAKSVPRNVTSPPIQTHATSGFT